MIESEIINLHITIMRNLSETLADPAIEESINNAYSFIYKNIKQTLTDELGDRQ